MVEYLARKAGDDISKRHENPTLRYYQANAKKNSDRDSVLITVIFENLFTLHYNQIGVFEVNFPVSITVIFGVLVAITVIFDTSDFKVDLEKSKKVIPDMTFNGDLTQTETDKELGNVDQNKKG